MIPVGPIRNKLAVADKYPWCIFMCFHDSYWLATLNKQSFIILQNFKCSDDCIECFEISCSLAPATVHNELIGSFSHFGIEIVKKHSQRRFLDPPFATDHG